MLSEQTIGIVKATAHTVAQHAEEITRHFYSLMFTGNPDVKAYFNPAHQHSGVQQRALAGAICAYAANIDNLEALGPAVEVIAQKHCSLGIEAEHYPIVGKHLLAAVKDVLGDVATNEVLTAWGEAYGFLAEIFIEREAEIYREQASRHGGWRGYRTFVVERKVPESDIVTSFYLRPQDGGPVPTFQPGQYVTVKIEHSTKLVTPRNYSLSDRPGLNYYRISVKREPSFAESAPDGFVSNHLHDHVQEGDKLQIGPPCGEFTLNRKQVGELPIVLLSGGIGVTPLMSMLKSLVHEGVRTPIHFIHAARNSLSHAFANEVKDIAADRSNIRSYFCYDDPLEDDVQQRRCDGVGLVDLDLLRKLLVTNNAEYYLCGPRPFMAGVYHDLRKWGVHDSQIHFEFFGPKQELTLAV